MQRRVHTEKVHGAFWKKRLVLALCCGAILAAVCAVSYYGFARTVTEQAYIALEDIALDAQFACDKEPLKDDPVEYLEVEQSDVAHRAYAKLYKAMWLQKDAVHLDGVNLEEAFDVALQLRYDHPELLNVSVKMYGRETTINTAIVHSSVELEIPYLMDRDETQAARRKVNQVVSNVLSRMPTSSDWSRAYYLHSWLCENVTYYEDESEYSEYSHNVADALLNGDAVCEGYALAYDLLCRRAGFESQVIVGYLDDYQEGDYAHAWNRLVVYGKPRYVDVTADDGDRITLRRFLLDEDTMRDKGYTPFPDNHVPGVVHID